MSLLVENHLKQIRSPANLLINEQISAFRKKCKENGCKRPYHHFAFGQSPFPPPPTVVKKLKANVSKNAYLPTAGLPELREAIASFYRRYFGFECEKERIVISPGSKEMISIALSVIQGGVIIPVPGWVSYLPQAKIHMKQIVTVRTQREDNFKLTPDLLANGANQVASEQKILILNHPHNPTGVMYTESELSGLAEVCRQNNIIVISDEIYALTAFDPHQFVSMAAVYPEGTLVTGGLSKDRSSGGYRFGVGIMPNDSGDLIKEILKVAGSTYSCVAAPIQHAALEAYDGNGKVDRHIRDSASVNALVARQMVSLVSDIPGVKYTNPQGGFYLYLDFNEYRGQFKKVGLKNCDMFCEHLLNVEHTALLPASALLLPEDDYSVRCSFVDFDGARVLKAWRWKEPPTPEKEKAFFRKNCPLVVDGVKYLKRYLEQVKNGNLPSHLMEM